MIRIFLDANVLIDIIADAPRPSSAHSRALYAYLIQHPDRYALYTTCDLFTTVYYVLNRAGADRRKILNSLKSINRLVNVMEFGRDEIDEAIYLMEKNPAFEDLEDTIQFVMARNQRCDYIVTNDRAFFSHDIPLLGSGEALEVLQSRD